MSLEKLVEVTIRNVFPVDKIIAAPPAKSSDPTKAGSFSKPIRKIISSDMGAFTLPSGIKNLGSCAYIAKPTTAKRHIRNSIPTTPINIPITAFFADFASFAEENF